MLKNRTEHSAEAQVIALKALAFLASDEERFGRFIDVTDLSPQAIRRQAADPVFLAGVLDHLRSDQTLLYLFAETENLLPERIDRARRGLPGATHDF
mgnify:FL=1